MTIDNCHAVVWIDHRKAEVVAFNRSQSSDDIVRHHDAPPTIHHTGGTMGSGHVHEDKAYLHAVAEALRPALRILITGPGQAKTELKSFLEKHEPALAARIAGVEAVDHPSEPQLLAMARKFFAANDRLRPG